MSKGVEAPFAKAKEIVRDLKVEKGPTPALMSGLTEMTTADPPSPAGVCSSQGAGEGPGAPARRVPGGHGGVSVPALGDGTAQPCLESLGQSVTK